MSPTDAPAIGFPVEASRIWKSSGTDACPIQASSGADRHEQSDSDGDQRYGEHQLSQGESWSGESHGSVCILARSGSERRVNILTRSASEALANAEWLFARAPGGPSGSCILAPDVRELLVLSIMVLEDRTARVGLVPTAARRPGRVFA